MSMIPCNEVKIEGAKGCSFVPVFQGFPCEIVAIMRICIRLCMMLLSASFLGAGRVKRILQSVLVQRNNALFQRYPDL